MKPVENFKKNIGSMIKIDSRKAKTKETGGQIVDVFKKPIDMVRNTVGDLGELISGKTGFTATLKNLFKHDVEEPVTTTAKVFSNPANFVARAVTLGQWNPGK